MKILLYYQRRINTCRKNYFYILFSLPLFAFAHITSAKSSFSNVTDQPYQIRYEQSVNKLLKQMNPELMWQKLIIFTQFPDRSADHQSGIDAEIWLQHEIEMMIKDSKRSDTMLYSIPTTGEDQMGNPISFPQSSIILKIGTSNLPGIVLGAHFDTSGCDADYCQGENYPGADDDGTGTVTLLETARVLLSSQMQFNKPIYIIWYAAEEQGRVGSKAVVKEFVKNNIPIDAVIQFDMTGYSNKNDRTTWIGDNGTYRHLDKNLTDYLIRLTITYVKPPVKIAPYIDESDYWSWAEAGFKTVTPMEYSCLREEDCATLIDPSHTNEDTVDKLSLTHMTNYLKMAIAFAAESAEPK